MLLGCKPGDYDFGFLGAILDKWLEIFTQVFASNSFAQEVGLIGRSLPFTSTHVMTSSGWIIMQNGNHYLVQRSTTASFDLAYSTICKWH
jgi:hypothetical protein